MDEKAPKRTDVPKKEALIFILVVKTDVLLVTRERLKLS